MFSRAPFKAKLLGLHYGIHSCQHVLFTIQVIPLIKRLPFVGALSRSPLLRGFHTHFCTKKHFLERERSCTTPTNTERDHTYTRFSSIQSLGTDSSSFQQLFKCKLKVKCTFHLLFEFHLESCTTLSIYCVILINLGCFLFPISSLFLVFLPFPSAFPWK